MSEPEPKPPLPTPVVEKIVEEILAWNGRFPLTWSPELGKELRKPAVFKTFIATFALIWGASPELAKTKQPGTEEAREL